VIEPPRLVDFAIWLVALALYVGDAARLLTPRQLLLVEAGGGRLAAVFHAYPFTLGGKALVFAPLLLPQRGAFTASWGRPWSPPAALRAALDSVRDLRATLLPARILAAWTLVVLFVAGPVLTAVIGTDPAVLVVAALVYPTALAAAGLVWWRRRAWGLGRGAAALLSAEILVCPAFLPNLVRKVTAAHALEVDGAQVLVATAADAVKAEFLGRLEVRAEELMHAADDEAAALRAYLDVVRTAR
jgi:hypothetical protein